MAIQTNTTQLAVLLGQAISEVYEQTGDTIKQQYKRVFKDIDSAHARLILTRVAYFSDAPLKPEGTQIQYDDFKVDNTLTLDPLSFGVGARFTKEALDDMKLEAFGDHSNSKLVSAAQLGKAFRNVCAQKIDVLAAELISKANSATATSTWQGTGIDAKALAASDHPILSATSTLGPTTFSNLAAASSLSTAALQTMLTTLETIPTQEGLVRPLGMKYKLVVGPANRMTGYTIVETVRKGKSVGTTDHDVPGLEDFDIELVVNPFLGSTYTGYALVGPDFNGGMWIRQAPQLDDEKDFETKGHRWSVDFRARSVFSDAYDYIMSAGA